MKNLLKDKIDLVLKEAFKMYPTGMFFSVVNHTASEFQEFKDMGFDVYDIQTINYEKTKELFESIIIGKLITVEDGLRKCEKGKSIIVCYPNGTHKMDKFNNLIPIHTFATPTVANRSLWLKGYSNAKIS